MEVVKIIPMAYGKFKVLVKTGPNRGRWKTLDSLEGLNIPPRYKEKYLSSKENS
jgi:hypothetical protein